MAKESARLAGPVRGENSGGLLSGLLADENEFDRRGLWRLGGWGASAVGAVIVAALANQSSLGSRREQLATAELARQGQQLQSLARDNQNETRRLASAVETLNGDRDRLFSRVTVLEQGLDSVTGALARQTTPSPAGSSQPPAKIVPSAAQPNAAADSPATPATQTAAAPPPVAPVGTTAAAATERPKSDTPASAQASTVPSPAPQPDQAATPAQLPKIAANLAPPAQATSLLPPKSLMGPPDPAASKLIEPARDPARDSVKEPTKEPVKESGKESAKEPSKPATPAAAPETAAALASASDSDATADAAPARIERTEFAVDLGSANSVGGLRALWRGLVKSNTDLASLRPIIVVKERSNGLGMQLRLAAGPLMDAAAAAKICAALAESERGCETTVFDGQRLTLRDESEQPAAATPSPKSPLPRGRRAMQRRSQADDPPPPKPPTSTLSALFGRK